MASDGVDIGPSAEELDGGELYDGAAASPAAAAASAPSGATAVSPVEDFKALWDGIETTLKWAEETQETSQNLQSFLGKYVAAEADHAKKLAKMCKSQVKDNEKREKGRKDDVVGAVGVQATFDAVLSFVTFMSDVHAKLSEQLSRIVLTELDDVVKNGKETIKAHTATNKKQTKEFENQVAKVEKIQGKFNAAAVTAEQDYATFQTKRKDPNLKPNAVKKLEEKAEKSRGKALSLDEEYNIALASFNEYKEDYNVNVRPALVESVYNDEMTRINQIHAIMLALNSCWECLPSEIDAQLKAVSLQIESINSDDDWTAFTEQAVSGDPPPPPREYIGHPFIDKLSAGELSGDDDGDADGNAGDGGGSAAQAAVAAAGSSGSPASGSPASSNNNSFTEQGKASQEGPAGLAAAAADATAASAAQQSGGGDNNGVAEDDADIIGTVVVLHDFTPGEGADTQIALSAGEIIKLTEKANENWWSGYKADGTWGYFPATFVGEADGVDTIDEEYTAAFNLNKNEEGVVTGMAALDLFPRYGVPDELLEDIWELSDTDKSGVLDAAEFTRALQLISLVQQGLQPTPAELAAAIGPIPCPKLIKE